MTEPRLPDPWRRIVAADDCGYGSGYGSGYGDLALPWQWGVSLYASDGFAGYAVPASMWQSARLTFGEHPKPTCVHDRMVAAREAAEPVATPLVPLMLWAGPLPSPHAVVCKACSGTGSVVWRVSVDGLWEPCALDSGGDVGAVGTYCDNCDGDGWIPSAADPVSVHGTTVDARRLARLLWALVRLGGRGDGRECLVRALPDRLHVSYGAAEALLVGMDPTRTTAGRSWPPGGAPGSEIIEIFASRLTTERRRDET